MQQTGTRFVKYINLYQTQWKDLMQSQKQDGIPLPAYDRCIWTTWMISFEAIREKNEAAADLLFLWAFLDHRDLWRELLDGMGERSVLAVPTCSSLREICRSEVAFNRAIGLLMNYCLVERTVDLGGYVMHPVVHQWARHMQSEEQRVNFARLAVTMIGHAVPSSSERDFWIAQRRFLGHAECCYQWVTDDWCQLRTRQEGNDKDGPEHDEKLKDVYDALLGLGSLFRDQTPRSCT